MSVTVILLTLVLLFGQGSIHDDDQKNIAASSSNMFVSAATLPERQWQQNKRKRFLRRRKHSKRNLLEGEEDDILLIRDDDDEEEFLDEIEEELVELELEEEEDELLEEELESFLEEGEEPEDDEYYYDNIETSTDEKVIQLDVLVDTSAGEMGNIIGESMTGQILKWIMEDKMMLMSDAPKIELNVRYVTPANFVKKTSQANLERCMPSAFLSDDGESVLTDFPCRTDFGQPLHYHIQHQMDEQTQIITELFDDDRSKEELADQLILLRKTSPSPGEYNPYEQLETFQQTIDSLLEVVQQMTKSGITIVESDRHQTVEDMNPENGQMEQFPLLSSPFIFVQPMTEFIFTVDHFYDRVRDHYRWEDNDPRCCNELPKPNETVLHARGFQEESKKYNFIPAEMNPHRTATELLGHLSPEQNDEVAIISRFDANYMKPFVRELEERGIPARSMDEDNNGEDELMGPAHDFCFLKNAKRGVAGSYRSTFIQWAIVLSDTIEHANLYVYTSDWKQHIDSSYDKPLVQISNDLKQKNIEVLFVQPIDADKKWEE